MAKTNNNLNSKLEKIKLLIIDVDGVLSRPYLIIGGNDTEIHEYRTFHIHDGSASWIAKEAGLILAIVSGRDSEAVKTRAKKMKIDEVHLGKLNKIDLLKLLEKKYSLKKSEIAFITDDFLDLPLIYNVGLSVAVNDAVDEVKDVADLVTESMGGRGALREIIQHILTAQNKWCSAQNVVLKKIYGNKI